ncbi:MAG TPA: DUF4231 domain-containing protein [Blastocatellia bacterium]|nr:DUF4231 domain-containing protein [Blastocatellia bacterium]
MTAQTTGRWFRLPAIFRRFPQLWLNERHDEIVPADKQQSYSELAADFALLDKYLMPYFRRFDNNALRAQNRFLWGQLVLIGGGAATSILGVVQAAYANQLWGVAEATLAALLAAVAGAARDLDSQRQYFTSRLKAERLRYEYFQFLGRIGIYERDADRVQRLILRVSDIEAGEKGESS